MNKPILGITMGDPFGNGPEITVKALADEAVYDRCRPVVIGDVSARRGNVLGMLPRGNAQQIDANIPLSNMFGYATDLRSRTQGRGQYAMEPSHYIELPKSLQEELVAKRSKG